MTRRDFLKTLGGAVAAAAVPGVVKALLPATQTIPAPVVANSVYVTDELLDDAVIDILEYMRKEIIKSMSIQIENDVLYGANRLSFAGVRQQVS